ncbi:MULTISPECIES: DUF6233 domain-containing protein [unclassified Streptomyces]|uniref:DUF6233 domain-containing protein n=1 Tax=unclassified Streptomyces TaxID=2593676 RepID=UPI002DDBD424|nr:MULTISPECIES: DUF6233 domain-containing protein [unclassified Streptomyces]WSA94555.1 DUF6233 domain-containing protein [Streptomyces sp. NBC_01795]WSB78975.1 DUF6233 domain-containing protein [Streptomyces sp. NBC_01775]WSS12823.1 DUF6233 domain-containing protein [Streptomyces sp. NBC_01186]WSS41607.1 DUF6233 domain-containing protein [Streptomyces sp. NBC_01187]
MPDDQELDVIVVSRLRSHDGQWWYECEAVLPTRYEHGGRSEAKAAPTRITVSADAITPLPGENYDALPTEGAVAGRQWLAVRMRGVRDEGPWTSVHRRDCWQAQDGWQVRRITAREALALLAGPEGRVCDVCRPDRALGSPPPHP